MSGAAVEAVQFNRGDKPKDPVAAPIISVGLNLILQACNARLFGRKSAATSGIERANRLICGLRFSDRTT
jgi:hypothetical protein